MQCRISDLRSKEVININTGLRLGYVVDALFDNRTGQIASLVAPGPFRFFGLFGRANDYVIPWACVKRIGDDIILIDAPEDFRRERAGKRGWQNF
ncbi:MAG: YlmC/YmxH family sporulation protein [Oscillospiraceae bacterium]|jgi:YlmC/YmxH family sporulation protein|nr:YlmC/YmxH family sporulation protein [Oscillospiraceae bacterium]